MIEISFVNAGLAFIIILFVFRSLYKLGYEDGQAEEKFLQRQKEIEESGDYIVAPYTGYLIPTRNKYTSKSDT